MSEKPGESHPWSYRNRQNRRERSLGSAPKLTAREREEIRRRRDDGESVRDLAVEFGVTASHVRQL